MGDRFAPTLVSHAEGGAPPDPSVPPGPPLDSSRQGVCRCKAGGPWGSRFKASSPPLHGPRAQVPPRQVVETSRAPWQAEVFQETEVVLWIGLWWNYRHVKLKTPEDTTGPWKSDARAGRPRKRGIGTRRGD